MWNVHCCVRFYWATVCKTVRPFALWYRSVVCLTCLSVCNVRALWPNGWTDQDETWHADRPRPQPHCVKWGPSPSLLFGPCLLWPNGRPSQQLLSSCYHMTRWAPVWLACFQTIRNCRLSDVFASLAGFCDNPPWSSTVGLMYSRCCTACTGRRHLWS